MKVMPARSVSIFSSSHAPQRRCQKRKVGVSWYWMASYVAVFQFLTCRTAGSQTEVYCNLTSVKIDTLSNATRVTLVTDGMIRGTFRSEDYAPQTRGGLTRPRALRVFPFRLANCRTKLGSFIDVSTYPISHLSLTIPRESREGVGLDVELVLYKRGYLDFIRLGNRSMRGEVPEPPGVRIQQSPDGHSVTIVVSSDRYREAEPPREEVVPTQTGLSVSVNEHGHLAVKALNVPLGQVLATVADVTDLRIVVRGGANYRASISVRDAPPDELLRAVARAYGLSVRSVAGTYFVTEGLPTEVDSYWASPTASFRLRHIPADEAVELLPDFLLRYVRSDPGDNALVATGPPQLLDKLEADLRKIDRPVPQIRLSALLVEEAQDGGLDAASALIAGSELHQFQTSGDAGQLTYRVVNDPMNDLHLKLRALEERGVIRTRVCPSVTVRSGSSGELFLGRRQYFAFSRPISGGWQRRRQEVVLEYADIGSRIAVTPWSGDGKIITVKLTVQANAVVNVDRRGLPLLATRRAWGTVRLDTGDTIVLGGLSLEMSDDQHRRAGPDRVPVVADLGRGRKRVGGQTNALVLLTAFASYETTDFAPLSTTVAEGGAG